MKELIEAVEEYLEYESIGNRAKLNVALSKAKKKEAIISASNWQMKDEEKECEKCKHFDAENVDCNMRCVDYSAFEPKNQQGDKTAKLNEEEFFKSKAIEIQKVFYKGFTTYHKETKAIMIYLKTLLEEHASSKLPSEEEFKSVFDFIEDEMVATKLDSEEIKSVFIQYKEWMKEQLKK